MESSPIPFSFRYRSKEYQNYVVHESKKSQSSITLSISLIVVTLLLCTFISTANYAYAHSLPVTETPASNSIIKKGSPLSSKVTIDFSERPDPNVSTIQVLNSKNERIDDGKFVIIGDHDREAQTGLNPKKLTDGVYTVSWMTQSADDGHIARGSYVFGIGNVGPGSTTTTQGSSSISSIQNNPRQSVQTVAVTSNLDGLIKWPLIVSEVAIVGGIFSHSFLWERFGNRIGVKAAKGNAMETKTKFDTITTIPWTKRFSLVIVIASATIIICASLLLFLQITELAANSSSNYRSIFESVLRGSSGISWLIHVITALIIMICILANYGFLRKYKEHKILKKSSSRSITFQSILFGIAFAAGAVCIFANSMTSHNAAVNFIPSLAVFIDWIHLMAVSLWIGGLFYISVVLLNSLRNSDTLQQPPPRLFFIYEKKTQQQELQVNAPKTNDELSRNKISATTYYLALLLPRFSLIATISLGVIGISGIYMAWIQLHSFNELFYSTYGNVLIIKLAIALPVVLLGTYHQIRIHNFISVIANIGKAGTTTTSSGSNKDQNSVNNNENLVQNFKNKDNQVIQKLSRLVARNKKTNNSNINSNNEASIFSRFGYTVKIESLLAIFLLLVASLLSITSPNSMSMASMPNMPNMPNMAHTPSSSSQMPMSGNQMQMQTKNSTLVKQANIMNVNAKIEINPFYSGFNTFKITFTDLSEKPYTKVTGAELIFKNEKADIGPIVVTMKKIQPNVFTVGTFIGLPGEWNIALAAQRQSDYDLNYDFTSKVANPPTASTSSPSSNTNMKMGSGNIGGNNNLGNSQNQEPMPKFDSFAILAIVLSIMLGVISWYTYKRSKQDLKIAIDRFEGGN
ncbi:MAG TPA: CopD family protein [Nitrososphaeraceae archaeon]|jgi:putative copper export protein/methionine-rich copper-binding protein CopC